MKENPFAHVKPIQNPVVGKEYLVPCIVYPLGGQEIEVPVHPHVHTDEEVSVPSYHVHTDIRFWNSFLRRNLPWSQKAIRYQAFHIEKLETRFRFFHCISEGKLPPDHLKNLMKRANPLSDESINKAAIQCGKCPHKGFPIDSSLVKNGIFHCPLHGLSFVCRTGKQV